MLKGKHKNIFKFLLAFVLLLPLTHYLPNVAVAETESDEKIHLGVIDMRNIIQRSNAMTIIRAALDEQNAKFQAAISAEELALRQAERDLNAQQSELTEAEFSVLLKEFEERVATIQRSIQNQKNSFDRSIQQAQNQLEQELLKIVSEIAKENSLSVVLQRQNVVIYNNALDITDDALKRLNEKTKNLKLTRQDILGNSNN